MAGMHQQLVSVLPGGRFLSQNGAFAFATGVPAPALNGVWFERPDPEKRGVASLLDEVSRARNPFSLHLPADASEGFTRLAIARGMEFEGELVLMAVSRESGVTAMPPPARLKIRELPPEEASRHAVVLAAAQALDEDTVVRAVSPDLLRLRAVRCYLGEAGGQPVSTALSVTLGPVTGIFCLATVPGARNLGFASAMTARALADSFAASSKWCWLEAAASCLPAFRRLGFRAVEPRQYWVSPVVP
jgi:ribosomal protein S18 acetylase RimI-like enzyme